ncbi:MAG: hypothetical protein CSB55_02970 [Candidatus Cloacimonadota bacterium]|nr:MAG: hypothetical protein CSB55_02970 [Candidatus Cloacimonadota bacterium]
MIVEISDERALELIDQASKAICKRRMAAPAIMAIESLRPLHFLASQALFGLLPFAEIFFKSKDYQEFAVLLEKDKYVSLLMKRIDEVDLEMYKEEREKNRLNRKRRWNKFKSFFKIKSKKK